MGRCRLHAFGWSLIAALATVAAGAGPSFAQGLDGGAAAAERGGTKWLLIVSGHPGDDEHRELFANSITRIRASLTDRFGFDERNVRVWFGADEQEANLEDCRGPATRDVLAEEIGELRKQVGPSDEVWVIVIGHAHPLRRSAQLNLPGPDVDADEFAEWFAGLECGRSVFFVTTPLSGYFLKPLTGEGRVVVSATEADLEVNETLFHSSFAEVLESFPAGDEHDVDNDGRYSLLDLYLSVAQHVEARYVEDDLLSTEHAQLEDNGDGRGSELQLNYLTSEDSNPPPRIVRVRAGKDGELATSIDLGRIAQSQE